MSNEGNKGWRRTRFLHGDDLKLFRPRFDWMINPRNGHEEKMVVLEGIDSVQVVGLTPQNEVILVKQYRFGIGEYILELPGGLIDKGETPAEAAVRELREETGWEAGSWKDLGRTASNPVFMDNYFFTFAAFDLQPTAEQALDPGEEVEVVRLPLEEVRRRLFAGEFTHPHTICGLVRFLGAE